MESSLVASCLKIIPNYFEFIILASFRAQELNSGSSPLLPAGQNRSLVVAMKEISQGLLTPETLRARVVRGFQECAFLSENETL
jgi:DNA-directed RNA polymerase omega subunit